MSLNVQGQLKGAQVENLSSDPSNLPHGRAWYNTTLNKIKVAISGVARAVLTEDGAAVVTNKDIDGATASNTNRITLPKDTKANLDGLTRKAGTVVYGTDTQTAYVDNGTSLVGTLTNPMTTGGDVIYGGASGTPTRLANGSDGQVLTSQGSTSAPAWAAQGTPALTIIKNTSSLKTPSATAQYMNMTDNDVTLLAGKKYEIDVSAMFDSSGGTPTYTLAGIGLYGSDGADSGTVPTLLTATSNLTVESGHVSSNGLLGVIKGVSSDFELTGGRVTVSVGGSNVTLYAVPFALMSTAANARVQVGVTAREIY